jgi:hypothetical protein
VIHPDVKADRINMAHARRLVDLCVSALPRAVTLYVFHDGGVVLRAWHSTKGKVDLGPGPLSPSRELAAKLAIEQEASDVQLIDLQARDLFLRETQDLGQAFRMNGVDYKLWVHEKKWQTGPGLVLYPKRDLVDRFVCTQRVKDFIRQRLASDAVFLLGVADGDEWWTSLILFLSAGEVVRIATFDDLPEPLCSRPPRGENPAQSLAGQASAFYGKKVFGLVLDREAFEEDARRNWTLLGTAPLAHSG